MVAKYINRRTQRNVDKVADYLRFSNTRMLQQFSHSYCHGSAEDNVFVFVFVLNQIFIQASECQLIEAGFLILSFNAET